MVCTICTFAKTALVVTIVCIKYKPAYKVTLAGEYLGTVESNEIIDNKLNRYLKDTSGNVIVYSTAEDVVQYFDCDQRPQFFGSSDLRHFLREWVYQYLKYPSAALQNGVQGTVMVEFLIEKDGKISNVRVAKGVSEELDAEALKVVQASPKWKPGKVSGNKVRSSVTVPVEFRLEKKSGKSSFGIKK